MGWSLGGILAGAAKGFGGGIADWAGREIAEEKVIAKELRAEERQLAAEERTNIEHDRRQDRVQELADKRALAEKEGKALTMGYAEEEAVNAGHKPGTPAYYEAVSSFLARSGDTAGAKDYLAHASKEELARERLAMAAARRNGGGGSGGKSAEEKEEARYDKLDERNLKRLEGLSTIKGADGKTDGSAKVVVDEAYYSARAAGMPPSQALTESIQISKRAQAIVSASKGEIDGYGAAIKALDEIVTQREMRRDERATAEAARGAAIINSVNSSIPKAPDLGGMPDSFSEATADPFGGLRGTPAKGQVRTPGAKPDLVRFGPVPGVPR